MTAATAAIKGRRLVADRSGRFKLRIAFSQSAPAGPARVTVRRAKRLLASKPVLVRPGATRTVILRLTAAGRRAIRRGASARVTVALRLPDGATVRKQIRLTRRR